MIIKSISYNKETLAPKESETIGIPCKSSVPSSQKSNDSGRWIVINDNLVSNVEVNELAYGEGDRYEIHGEPLPLRKGEKFEMERGWRELVQIYEDLLRLSSA